MKEDEANGQRVESQESVTSSGGQNRGGKILHRRVEKVFYEFKERG